MNSLIYQHRAALEGLCRRYGVQRLEVFGSAAVGGELSEGSDLDFLVEFASPPPGGYADASFGLLESLEALSGKPVALVVASAIRTRSSSRRLSKPEPCFMQLEAKKYLYDIQQAAQQIVDFTASRDISPAGPPARPSPGFGRRTRDTEAQKNEANFPTSRKQLVFNSLAQLKF
jgi:predicted nucleotidyltransferase